MVAATITTVIETNNPTEEIVILTATDEETYTSKKFGRIRGVQATWYEDMLTLTYPVSIDISGAIATINCEGVTDKLLCLTLYGER